MPLSTFFRCFFPGHTANPSGFIKCWCTFITANQSGPIWKRKVVFNSTKLNLHPPKTNMEAEKKTTLGQGDSQKVDQWTSPPFLRCLPWRDSHGGTLVPFPPKAKATLNQSHERCPRPTQKQSFKQLQVGTGFHHLDGGGSTTKKALNDAFYGRKNLLPNKDERLQGVAFSVDLGLLQ